MINKILNRIISVLQYYKLIFSSNYKLNYSKPIAFIDFKDRRFDVYYSCLLYFLHESGYQLVINKNNILAIGNRDGYFKYIPTFQKITYLSLKELINKKVPFDYFCDLIVPENELTFTKIFKINLDYFNFPSSKLDKIAVPYPLHPSNYLVTKSILKLEDYRNNIRKFRLFFSGNTIKEAYDNENLKNKFIINSRHQIIDFIKNEIDFNSLTLIKDINSWEEIKRNGFNGMVLIDWFWLPNNMYNMSVKIPAEKWLETLSMSSFFLSCPGVVMPHSHNIIEAMSVGTIPLIQFGNQLFPPLIDGKNAVFFKDLSDLKSKIEYIINLEEEKILLLSKNVIKYYEEYLSPSALYNQISILPPKSYEMYLNVEYVSVMKYYNQN